MQKNNSNLTPLVPLVLKLPPLVSLIVWPMALGMLVLSACVSAESPPIDSKTYVAEKYVGKYDELAKNGYTTRGSIGNGSGLQRVPEVWVNSHCRAFLPEKQLDCIFVLIQIKERDVSGHPIYSTPFDMIHIKLPKDWNYFDSGDTECKAAEYPNSNIVAIGQWEWRKKPLHGGYAHSLKKAWRIDYQKMRFVEISTQGVGCGFEDDRN